MNTVSKALLGTVAAGAMAVTSASPAAARDRDNGISAGEVIAGAVILGGIAAIASSIGKDRNRGDYRYDQRYDQRHRDNYYQSRGNPRSAVDLCVQAAQTNARRYGYDAARVVSVRDVSDTRKGWRVKGRIVVNEVRNSGYRNQRYDANYRARSGSSRYGYGQQAQYRDFDGGNFTCKIERGRIVDIDYDGIRGLR